MKMTSDEYRRGLLSWSPEPAAYVQTATTDSLDEPPVWSEPLTNPAGSKIVSPPARFRQFRFVSADPGQASMPHPARWEFVWDDNVLKTAVRDTIDERIAEFQLVHIPNYGTFHRLVVEVPPALSWSEDQVVRVGDVGIRLVIGRIVGERAAPLDQVEQTETGTIQITSDWSGTTEREGRFIEIVAPGASPEDAQARASTLLGLLGLVFGDAAVGQVVIAEDYIAEAGKPQTGVLRTPLTAKFPSAIDDEGIEAIDGILGQLFDGSSLKRAVELALHWYERGVRSPTPLDALICFFVGVEAIVNAFSKDRGGTRDVIARKSRYGPGLKKLLKGMVDEPTYQLLLRSLAIETTRDRFAFYVKERRIERDRVAQFNELARLRNSALHGDPVEVAESHSVTAKSLLVEMLKRELGNVFDVPWDRYPKMVEIKTHYSFKNYGYWSPE